MKYIKYFSFPWSPLEAAVSIFNVAFFVKTIFYKDFIKTTEIVTNS